MCDKQNTQILRNTLFNNATIASEQQPHERVPQKQKDFLMPEIDGHTYVYNQLKSNKNMLYV